MFESVQIASKKAASSAEEYIDATQDYVELKVFQQVSMSLAMIVKAVLIGGLAFTGLILLLIAGILLWGDYLGSTNLALLYTAIILFVISVLIFIFRKQLVDAAVLKKTYNSFFK